MAKTDSPYVVGDWWLDRRSDGRSPEIWQITRYDDGLRAYRYTSTRECSLEAAKRKLDHAWAQHVMKQPTKTDDALVIPHLVLYWDEHGKTTASPDSIEANIRAIIGFLMQDPVTPRCRMSDVTPVLIERFRKWRMAPHRYTVAWKGKEYTNSSPGVVGESVQKNITVWQAALNHAENNQRIPRAPKLPSLKSEYRSPPRDRVLTDAELGSILFYARHDEPLNNFVLLLLGTACRPEAALQMVPSQQFRKAEMLIDIHPKGAARTKKRNPVIPCIPQLAALLDGHKGPWIAGANGQTIGDMKKRWRTLRTTLGLSDDVYPKTIRHTVATRLRSMGADPLQISGLLGHATMNRTTEVYAKYDPKFLDTISSGLPQIWDAAHAAAERFAANHLLTTGSGGKKILLTKSVKMGQIRYDRMEA